MTQEEKAKAYDEAIEKAKKWRNAPNVDKIPTYASRVVNEIFPELAMSEDERIRKEIVRFIQMEVEDEILGNKWLAWLKKQGEQKPANNDTHEYEEIINGIIDFVTCPNLLLPNRKQEYITFLEDMKENGRRIHFSKKVKSEKQVVLITESNGNAYIDWDTRSLEDARKLLECGLQYINTELEKQGEKPQGKSAIEIWKDMRLEVYQQASGNRHEPNYSDDNTKMFSLNDIDEIIEKLSEQKPTDKAEPKFREGDWVVTDKNNVVQIKATENGKYVLENTMKFAIDYVDKCWRKWSIQDAKDGDVLVEDSCIFIIKKMNPNGTAIVHCCLFDDGEFDSMASTLSFDIDSTYPATKEQRDTLMDAMADAGWEFDFEKKELKKIEQKPTDEEMKESLKTEYDNLKVGDKVIIHCNNTRDEYTHKFFDNQIGKIIHIYDLDRNPWGNIVVILENMFQDSFFAEELEPISSENDKEDL